MSSTIARRRRVLLVAIAPLLAALPTGIAWGAPRGGQVVAGSAAISSSGNTLLVHQATNRAIINWTDFSINPSETVQFVLPSASSAVLNRVTSLSPSELNGTLLSNGSVYLINPNGILVGPTGQINVHGFVASSLDVNNAAFLVGGSLLFSGDSAATVTNQGIISASGGEVVLIARQVRNDGQINAPAGSVALAAGTQVLLQQTTSPGMMVRVVGDGSATNTGVIQTTLAQLAANGGNAFALAINNTGVIRATGVQNASGHIYLTAGPTGAVNDIGTLDASSSTGDGGEIVVTGQTIMIDGQAHLTADGATGGGQILVGGSWQGADPTIAEALTTTVQSDAVLDASATQWGDGGTVVVRSEVSNPASLTSVYGSFFARGGPLGGNGGRIETSGYSLDTAGATVVASATNGHAGQWLLDPYNVAISGSSTNSMNESSVPWVPTATANIDAADIDSALNAGSSVTIYTGGSNGGSDLGNITVNAAIAKIADTHNVTLTLEADNNITINSPISASSGELNIVLDAHYSTGGSTAGVIILGASLSTNGGYISFGTGRTNGGVLIGGDVYLNGSSAQTLSTVPSGGGAGGSVTVYGQMIIANPSGLTISTAGGAVDFESTVDSGDSYALGGDGDVTWNQALVDAQSGTAAGTTVGDTYLATITTSLQNQVAANAAGYQDAWLGAHRPIIGGGNTSQIWYWSAGPLGQANGGLGTAFFTQVFMDTGGSVGGGTPINNAFTNWNPGEPNNFGSANTTFNGESALEFTGSNAVWNDLPNNSNTNPYLVETNLAASPLNINAGAGQVTFKGLVGSNKALASLTVTGPVAMNGGGVTATTAQTYNNPMTLGSSATILSVTNADLNIGQNISYSGASAASLTLQASGSVMLAAGASVAAAGSGALGVTADSAEYGGTSGAIVMNAGSAITTNGGNVVLGGGSTPSSSPAYGTATYVSGVSLLNATITAGAGNVAMDGQGYSSGSSANTGVLISRNGASGAGSTVTTSSGSITLVGTGGNTPAAATGVTVNYASTVQATGTGNITIIGAGGPGSGDGNHGAVFDNSYIAVNTGVLNASGTAGAGSLGSGITGQSGTQVVSTGGGPITLIGMGNFGGFGLLFNGSALIGGTTAGNVTLQADNWNMGGTTQIQGTSALAILPDTAGTSMGLGVSATGTLNLNPATLAMIQPGFSSITFSASTGSIDVEGVTLTTTTNFVSGSGGMTIGGALNVGPNTLSLTSGGAVTQTAPITANALLLGGAGSFTLNNASNAITTIAANASGGALQYTNNGSLIVGSVGGTNGVTDTGAAVTLVAQGLSSDITLNHAVSGVGSGSTVVLAAGRNFINNVGSSAIGTSSGRFLVYSTNPAADTLDALTAADEYDATYAGNPPGSITASGNQFLYSFVPTLTVTATDQTKIYGQTNPTLTYTFSGLLGNDTIGHAVTGSPLLSTAAASAGVGNYAIDIGGGTLVSSIGYAFSFVAGHLAVTPAPLTIAAENASKIYGAALPIFNATYNGLVNNDTSAVISGLGFTSSATAASGVGGYTVTPRGATSPNYDIAFGPGTLAITKAPLAIMADDQIRGVGSPNPPLTAGFVGLVNGDLPSVVTGLVLSTTANIDSPVGQYPIEISGGTSANYNFTLAGGSLQVANFFVQDLRTQGATEPTLAPNFAPNFSTQPGAASVAHTTPLAIGLAELGVGQGDIFYRDMTPAQSFDLAGVLIRSDGVLLEAIAHSSSFDRGLSSSPNATVANDFP